MMEYKGYHADVKYSDEDKLFIGEVIGLNDTLAFHGSSVSELEAMFHQSVDNYLEMCQEFGKKPEKEYRGQVNLDTNKFACFHCRFRRRDCMTADTPVTQEAR